jgi:hypothetical protein
LPRYDKPSPGFFFDNFPVVLFVERHTYNTVVLEPADNGDALTDFRKVLAEAVDCWKR